VENDFESLTIFINEFALQQVVQGFESVSIPECESIQKKSHSMVLVSRALSGSLAERTKA
jgi:hypothetical protein